MVDQLVDQGGPLHNPLLLTQNLSFPSSAPWLGSGNSSTHGEARRWHHNKYLSFPSSNKYPGVMDLHREDLVRTARGVRSNQVAVFSGKAQS
jgi:hypothetical protein